ncbi:hypothetical protein A0128_17480 [Leptospira tipperaryensis]|uniref:Uncharacterized protein n=1 Tax=Leptospira tipperaryensis TaxID=2564040 RepID=A0A1D7V0W0_9LEPT|nr:hypothetical protein [Leptospira tipperaryensis]AOP35470.1 hypothetical protein A0128_17480 [Leptospira tipperaryensis]
MNFKRENGNQKLRIKVSDLDPEFRPWLILTMILPFPIDRNDSCRTGRSSYILILSTENSFQAIVIRRHGTFLSPTFSSFVGTPKKSFLSFNGRRLFKNYVA